MRYTQEKGPIRYICQTAPGVYTCMLYVPKIASAAAIGQFVGVLCEGYELRRPISLCGFDAGLGLLRLVFEVRGKGTEWLSAGRRGRAGSDRAVRPRIPADGQKTAGLCW